ncbi:MAG: DUF58 domain-containing protein [Verrucomicrobia bacterium]|nr:DUF58 domain-containing protein [Verrucomicrobiota bacterium]
MMRRIKSWISRRMILEKGRLTPTGWLVAGCCGFSAIPGLDLESSLAHQVFALTVGLGTIALLHSLWFRARLDVQRALPRFVTAGEPFHYWMEIRNLGHRILRGLEVIERPAPSPKDVDEWTGLLKPSRRARSFGVSKSRAVRARAYCRFHEVGDLPIGGAASVRMEMIPGKRGVLDLEAVAVARRDALGLLRSFRLFRNPQRVVVLPKRYWLPDLALPGKEAYQHGGITQAGSIGRAEEFVSLRDYRRGDPMRHIHWRSWARRGEPIVKEFEDDFFVRHGLVLDTFDTPEHQDVFEEAVSLAASFACQIRTQDSLLDLMFVGAEAYRFTTGRGLAHADQMLEILASAEPSGDSGFDSLATLVLRYASTLTGCILVFLKWDSPRMELTRRLIVMGLPVRVILCRPSGEPRQVDPGVTLLDPAHLIVVRAGSVQEDLGVMR